MLQQNIFVHLKKIWQALLNRSKKYDTLKYKYETPLYYYFSKLEWELFSEGLASIMASCASVTNLESILIGTVGALLVILAIKLTIYLK